VVAPRRPPVDPAPQLLKPCPSRVEPILGSTCAFGTCHSSEQSDFFLACQGSGSDDLTKFNFLEAQAFIGNPVDQSKILLKPLAPSAGGISHTGGGFFDNKTDGSWSALRDWVTENGPPAILASATEGQRFFNDRVMPIFLKRG